MTNCDRITEIYLKNYDKLLRLARRHLADACNSHAEDVLQWSWVKATTSIDQLRDPERAEGWLYTIVKKRAIEVTRNTIRKHGEMPLLEGAADSRDESLYVDKAIMRQQAHDVMVGVIKTLPASQRTALEALLDAGRLHGYTSSTGRVAAGRGRAKVKAALEAKGIDSLAAAGY